MSKRERELCVAFVYVCISNIYIKKKLRIKKNIFTSKTWTKWARKNNNEIFFFSSYYYKTNDAHRIIQAQPCICVKWAPDMACVCCCCCCCCCIECCVCICEQCTDFTTPIVSALGSHHLSSCSCFLSARHCFTCAHKWNPFHSHQRSSSSSNDNDEHKFTAVACRCCWTDDVFVCGAFEPALLAFVHVANE